MTKTQKQMIKDVLILCIIALISSLLLSTINLLTYVEVDPLEEQKKVLADFKAKCGESAEFSSMIVGENGDVVTYENGAIIYYATSTNGINAFLSSGKGGYGDEDLQLYVFIKDNKIYKILEGKNAETNMNMLDDANYYQNFYGVDVSGLNALSKDKVSGATMSTNAVKNAVDVVCDYYKTNVLGGE